MAIVRAIQSTLKSFLCCSLYFDFHSSVHREILSRFEYNILQCSKKEEKQKKNEWMNEWATNKKKNSGDKRHTENFNTSTCKETMQKVLSSSSSNSSNDASHFILTANQKENVSLIVLLRKFTALILWNIRMHCMVSLSYSCSFLLVQQEMRTFRAIIPPKKTVSIVKRLTLCTHAKVFLCDDAWI